MLGRTTATPDDARGRRQRGTSRRRSPRRCSTSAARRLDPRGDRRQCWSGRSSSDVVVTSRRLVPCETPAGSRLLERPGGSGRRRGSSAARPAPTGSSSGTPTRSSAAGHQPPVAHPRRVRRPARGDRGAAFYAEVVARIYLSGAVSSMRPRTLWGATAALDDADVRLHRGRRPAVGRPPAALGRARQPGPRRGAPRLAAAHPRDHARLRAGPARGPARRGQRTAPSTRRTKTSTPPSRTGSPAGCPGSGRAAAHRPLAQRPGRQPTCGSTSRTGCSPARCRRWRWSTALLAFAAPPSRRCSGPATPTSGGRCRRRSGSGPARTPRACSIRSSR